ncbi:MAG TPA: RHS repeat-associated core domain-containing protein [Cyclobacteriaceae bacterium]|jgi:hypothetical protein|nr:RHS repeat-associated core domain-containing protein [Cyclobacteriaceae bacterium]HRF34215.1 RHS repeat-associated core domain-containing protein [Cyclobacteriaceae bacterium]
MFYREYDPALGRMTSVDPVAGKYSSLTPYNYAFNDPVTYNDPLGDDASDRNYGKFLYFNSPADFSPQDAHAGPGGGGMFGSEFIRYGPGNSILMGYLDQMWADTEDVKSDKLSIEAYAARYGQSFGGMLAGLTAGLSSLMPNQVFNVWAGKQKASGGYRGAWQTYSSTIRDLVEERGYKLRLRYKATNITQGVPSPEELSKRFGASFREWAEPIFQKYNGKSFQLSDLLDELRAFDSSNLRDDGLPDVPNSKFQYTLRTVWGRLDVRTPGKNSTTISQEYFFDNPQYMPTYMGTVINPGIGVMTVENASMPGKLIVWGIKLEITTNF